MTGTAREIAAYLRGCAERLRARLNEAERENVQDVLATARLYSSGPYSRADLRRLGHPYARRRPRPPLPPGIVNVQTGTFLAGWRVEGPDRDLASRVVNETDRAEFMRGTARMIRRPIAAAVERETAERVEARRQAALRKAFPER